MKISLITAVLNRKDTIGNTLDSILNQTYEDIECIVVDGVSSDGSLDIIKDYESKFNGRLIWISEPDEGLYDAMNKGIKLATGDIVAVINSDDFYHSNSIIEKVANTFAKHHDIEGLYGDVHFVLRNNPNKLVRYYSSKNFTLDKFKYGFMPAHPSFFTYKRFYEKWGYFKKEYKISGDFELLLRFMKVNKMKTKYVEEDFVTMRTGGMSTSSLNNIILNNKEILQACKENNVSSSYFSVLLRYFKKMFEWIPPLRHSN